MGRYTGPKGRVNRRLNENVYESSGSVKALSRKEYPPGMHKRRKKETTYGAALTEKQKIKYYYGLRDRQLYRYLDIAKRTAGNTGATLLVLCERRLDNVVRRAGLTLTRPQARQGDCASALPAERQDGEQARHHGPSRGRDHIAESAKHPEDV